jgi:hypothetical protein
MVRTIQVNYDLTKPVRDYSRLYAYLESYNTRARPLQSMWLLRTTKTAHAVASEVAGFVDRDDRVIVIDVTQDEWWSNFNDDHIRWMHNQMGHLRAA